MAQRRMFSKQIVSTDAFMEMPVSTQLLYFHLSMEADDDGFVSSPRRILKNINCGEVDYKLLIMKRFIIPFENGICVIKHWLIHNYIQKDRYTPTTYIEEKNLLEIKENGVYTECIQDVSSLETQVRLGKDRLGEVRLGKDIKEPYGEFKNVLLKGEDYMNLRVKFGDKNADILIQELSSYMASKGKRYLNHYATLLNWGRRKIQTHQEKIQPKKRTII
jgi:hypothetical protein